MPSDLDVVWDRLTKLDEAATITRSEVAVIREAVERIERALIRQRKAKKRRIGFGPDTIGGGVIPQDTPPADDGDGRRR